MAFADLELIRVLKHVFHCDGFFACQLFEVIREVVHLAQADRFSECDHAFRREGCFGVFFECAFRCSRNAHRVKDGIVLFVGDGLISDVVAGRLIAVIHEVRDGHQFRTVDIHHRIVVFVGNQCIRNHLGGVHHIILY